MRNIIKCRLLVKQLAINLDRFYTLTSYWLLYEQIYNIMTIIFTLLYITLTNNNQPQFKYLLLINMFQIILLDFAYYYFTGRMTNSYRNFYESVMNNCVLIINRTNANLILAKKLSSIKIELFQLKYYEEKIVPRLFYITFLEHTVHWKIFLFCINFSIVLYQTEI